MLRKITKLLVVFSYSQYWEKTISTTVANIAVCNFLLVVMNFIVCNLTIKVVKNFIDSINVFIIIIDVINFFFIC